MTPVGPQNPAAVRSEGAVGPQSGAVGHSEPPSVGDLFSKLGTELATLVSQEINLAKTEMMLKAKAVVRNVIVIGVGAGFGLVALLVLTAALILGLATLMEPWLAALVVGAVFAAISAAAVLKGKAGLSAIEAKPEMTIETLKENKQWAQELVR